MIRKLLFILPCLLTFHPLSAQIELNVKLKPSAQQLQAYWTGNQANLTFSQQALEVSYPFLTQLSAQNPILPVSTNSFKAVSPEAQELRQLFTLRFDQSQNVQNLIAELMQTGAFEYVEENRLMQLHRIERASYIPDDDSLSNQWYHNYIRSFEAWDITRGAPSVKVGIIDTGLDFDHPEFEGQVHINPGEDLNGNGLYDPWPSTMTRNGRTGDFDDIDSDGNGYTDDVVGFDFTNQPRNPIGGDYLFEDPHPDDDNDHGTMVAGVISARHDNQYGGAGLAPDCKLVIIRAFGGNGSGEDDDIARAIIYAADNGVDIINMSFGDIYPSLMVHEAIKYAHTRGVIMVGSAGNGKGDNLHYPSGFSEVISVSASAADLENNREFLFPLSSYGVTVDLCAPGAGIFTTVVLDTLSNGSIRQFTRTQGTSFSAPMVSAATALILSHKGPRTTQQIRGILTTSADDISDPGWDHFTGGGRLNMLRALQVIGSSNVEITSPETDRGSDADVIYIFGSVLDPELNSYSLEYKFGTEDEGEWQPIISDQIYQIKDDTLAAWDVSNLPEGEYTLRLRADRTNGFSLDDRIRFIRDKSPPEIEISRIAPAWDNDERKMLIIFRTSDQAIHTLHYRPKGSSTYKQLSFDRTTRNGEFLLGTTAISSGDYEFFIQSENLAGLSAKSPVLEFSFQSGRINQSGYNELSYTLPIGRFLENTFDFDKDGLAEVVMNEYGERLSFGQSKIFEFNGSFFVAVDSLDDFREILIPKDITDANGNGLLELLCSANDSSYILEQAQENSIPRSEIWANEDNGLYAANFADTDGDGQQEILMRNDRDFFVFESNGGEFTEAAKLENVSPDYAGPGFAKTLVDDFDGDGRPEIIFGDNDADFLIYEHVSGNNYSLVLVDSTKLANENGEVFLTKGDFDGDNQMEFFIAIHTSDLENEDIEFDTPHWWLRIFKASGNDQYEVVYEDFLYDIDTKNLNALTAGNLDTDAADELVFTTFPRTYILDYVAGQYQMVWFLYGTLATHHIIADFDKNGVNELGLGTIDQTTFFEKDVNYSGPQPVNELTGKVLGPNQVHLNWSPSPGASAYQVWRVENYPANSLAAVFSPVTGSSFTDQRLTEGVPHLYVLRAMSANDTSGFGRAIFLRPHERPQIDSLVVLNQRQLEVHFTQTVLDREDDKAKFILNGETTPLSIIKKGDQGKSLLLAFEKGFKEGLNTLQIDTTFQDADLACLIPSSMNQSFIFEKTLEESLYLTQWESIGDKDAILNFNWPLDENTALDTNNYALKPYGSITNIQWASDDMDAVQVTIADARFGALGYPISITLSDVCAIQGVCIGEEGNTATFSSHKDDLTEVFVYPNPSRNHELFNGVRFANLTQQATIEVFTVSGRFVNRMEETDGDGGYEWDLLDQGNNRIKPGIYIYRVYTETDGVEDFVGKLSVVE